MTVGLLLKSELRRALQGDGCPLCTLAREDEDRHLHSVLREGLSSASFLNVLTEAGGFCARHAWALQRVEQREWRDGLTNACYERPLLADALSYLDDLSPSGRAARRHRRTSKAAPCPACVSLQRMREIRASGLGQALQDPALGELFAARRQGLCMPHFRLMWRHDMPDEVRQRLLETQRRQVRELLGGVDQYLRKHNWFVREAMLPDEEESWRWAVALLSGEPPVGIGLQPSAPVEGQAGTEERPGSGEG